jgi:transcriptional regulator with XRE-family HTH domain
MQLKSTELGKRLRERREELRITQEDLGVRVGRDQRAISEYESGKRRLSAIDMPVFAKALEVSMLYFFEGEVTQSDFDVVILKEFNRLPTDAAKETAIELLRMFSNSINAHFSSKP